MLAPARRQHRAHEDEPDEEEARELLGDRDPGVEAVAQHDVAEDQDDHDGQHRGRNRLDRVVEELDPTRRGHGPSSLASHGAAALIPAS
jgi:hypothetical protein